ncbi:MAG: tetratricopeptide repeat protein [Bdellovibrionales bacterium]|nr:tetratricopeptide repeat protein [Bdellovibrionales bacterium]
MKFKAIVLAIATAQILSSCATNNEPPRMTVKEKQAETYYDQGTSELIDKLYTSALANLLKARDLNPKDSKIRNNLGMAYHFRDQFALAETELKEAIKLDPNNIEARLNLGSIYMSNNRLKDARVQYIEVEKNLTFLGQFRNYYNLAVLELKEGDRKSAFDYLFKALAEKPDYCPAHFMLGEMYTEEFRYKEAYDSFKMSGKGTCVSEPDPQYYQALALLNLGRTQEAKLKFLEVEEKFSKTRFGSMAALQLKKIRNELDEQSEARSTRTEKTRSSEESVETPNF